MLVLEALSGLRVVASPKALDGARWSEGATVLRIAPDDAFAIEARDIQVADQHVIVEQEAGFVGAWLTAEQLASQVARHIEWPLPRGRPALAQGLIAGVPAKLWLEEDRVLLLCAAAYARELADRLG